MPLAVHGAALCKRYGDVEALCDIDLEIPLGGVFGVIGANGAGKTTLMRVLQGREAPDRGVARVLGTDARRMATAERAEVGVQLERGGLPPYLQAAEVLRWLRALHPRGRDEATLLESLGIARCAGRRVRDLSTGQHRRLAVAAALVGAPRIVFLDEPSLGLDPRARRALWNTLRDAARAGVTFVLCTNSMEEAEVLCDRVALLREGRLLDVTTPAEWVERFGAGHRIIFESALSPRLQARLEQHGAIFCSDASRRPTLRTQDAVAVLRVLSEASGDVLPRFRWLPPRLEDAFNRIDEEAR